MKSYIGTKVLRAEPQAQHDMVDGAAVERPGYRVVYPDGYESWSPAEVFEAAYHPLDGPLPFPQALELMLRGEGLIARAGWASAGLRVALLGSDEGSLITEPLLALLSPEGRGSAWQPSHGDIVATDWLLLPAPDAREAIDLPVIDSALAEQAMGLGEPAGTA